MNLADSPYPAGTPQHDEWVRHVYIPTELRNPQRWATDAQRAGATSIGGRLIIGTYEDRWRDELERLFAVVRVHRAAEALNDAMAQLAAFVGQTANDVRAWLDAMRPNPTLAVIASQRKRRRR